jgi:hypothetical protein
VDDDPPVNPEKRPEKPHAPLKQPDPTSGTNHPSNVAQRRSQGRLGVDVTPGDAARALAHAAAFDCRRVGKTDSAAWYAIIGNYELADCIEAITEHYRHETRYIMPSDVRAYVQAKRDKEQSKQTVAQRREIEAAPRSPKVTALIQELVEKLPQMDPQQKAIKRARKERARPLPKTKSRDKNIAKQPKDYPPPAGQDVAAFARAYLKYGYTPEEVSQRLHVSKRWCQTAQAEMRRQ